jgi:hypothetical protein
VTTRHKGKGPHRQRLDGGGADGVDGRLRRRSDTRGSAVTDAASDGDLEWRATVSWHRERWAEVACGRALQTGATAGSCAGRGRG